MTVLTVKLPTERDGAELVIALDGQVVQASRLDLAMSAGSAHAHVSTLLASGTFGDEVVGADDHIARRYGFELWTWLTRRLDEVAVDRFVNGTESVVQICGPPSLQALHWELLNAAPTGQSAQWVAETIAVRRVLSNAHLSKRELPADGRVGDVVIVSARPYLDEDIAADRPVRQIAETLGTSATFRWLPGARRETLRRAADDLVSPLLLHLDMHGVRSTKVVSAIGGAVMVPHLLLESERGADPVTVTELLQLIGGKAPRHLLLTSCESDATDVVAPDGFAEQAFVHGVESVVMARRRLTPDEVEILSEVVHGSVADGVSIDYALLRARRSLFDAARSPSGTGARIGGFAWAAFTHYVAPAAEAVTAAGSSSPDGPVSSQVLVPPLPSAISDGVGNRRIAVVQVDDPDHAATLIDGLAWWAARLAGNFRFHQLAPASDVSEAIDTLSAPAGSQPVVRFHDWLALTAPERLLANAEDLRSAIPLRSAISLTTLDHGMSAVTVDVIVVSCSPSHVIGQLSDPRLTTSALRRFSDWSGSLDGAGVMRRWLTGVDERLAPGWSLTMQDDIPDPAYDSLLASMASTTGGDEHQLWAGLASCSVGLLRRSGYRADLFEAAFDGLSRFADIAFDVGLAVRTEAGRWVLDRYHPRLAAAIQRAVSHRSVRNPGPWLDWEFRVAATAKELAYETDGFLPDYRTLSGRLARPDVALGPALAETTDRNYVAYAIARLADGTPPSTWHGPASPGDQVRQVFDQINQRRRAEEQRRRDAQPAPKPGAEIATLTGSSIRPDLAGAAFIDLEEQSRADLASALLANGPTSGLGVLQPREMALNAIEASFLGSDQPPAREILRRLSQDFAWAEDQAHLFLDAGVMFMRRGYIEEGAAFLDIALQLNMSAEGEHPAGHCVEILTMRAQRHREAGRSIEWRRDVRLAERFILTNPWWMFTIHVTSLIAELRAAGQVADHLRLTAHLMRTYQPADSPPSWLTHERARSLAGAGRTTEAVELLRAIDTDELAARTRSIIELEIADGVQDVDPPGAFDLYLQVATYATDSVLASALTGAGCVRHLARHQAGAPDAEDEALELLRRAALTLDGGLASMEACIRLSWQLLFAGHGEEALGWIDRLGVIDEFPVSAQVAALRAGALVRLHRPDEEIRSLLLTAWWGHSGRTWARLREIFEQEGRVRVLSDSWYESMELQRRWILEGEPTPPAGIELTPLAFAAHRRTVALSEPFDHREFDDQHLERLTMAVLGDWSAWSGLANELWNRGRLPEALIYFDMCRIGLDSHGGISFDERIRSALTSSLYSLAVLCRRTGDRAGALKWGSLLIQRLEGLIATSGDVRPRADVDQLSRVYQLVGNLYYDSGNFAVSLTFHAQALAVECGVSAEDIDIDSLIEASSSAPEVWQAVHALCNLGNSLGALGRASSFSYARYCAVILAGELPDLEVRARQSDEAFVLGSIQQGFVRDVPREVPLGRALHAIRSALANAGA